MRCCRAMSLILLAWSIGLGTSGCSKAEFGEACAADGDCESGVCRYWSSNGDVQICVEYCQDDDDCPSAAFCVDYILSVSGTCVPLECSEPYIGSPGDNDRIYRCVEGQLVACSDLMPQERLCSTCACADDAYCDYQTLLCQPKKPTGASCEFRGDCLSEECDEGICSELVGAVCSEYCSVCMGDGAFCTKVCYPDTAWECGAGLLEGVSATCARPTNSSTFYCLPFCDGGVVCPGTMTCVPLDDGTLQDRHVCIDT
jgi:hypothetical protein